jgi:serine/threonine protein kinase
MVYSVYPLIEGCTLQDNLAWFHDLNQALGLFSQLTAGLEYLHNQGYVHGNLKSSNTFMDPQRKPLLSEFGVARLPTSVPDPYKSPEEVQGGVIDRRTDIYAMGVLLYEVLVGELPPPGIVVSPRARRPDLPEAVERVVLKAMAQNPDQRYQSASEFQAALQSAVQMPAQPITPPTGACSNTLRITDGLGGGSEGWN